MPIRTCRDAQHLSRYTHELVVTFPRDMVLNLSLWRGQPSAHLSISLSADVDNLVGERLRLFEAPYTPLSFSLAAAPQFRCQGPPCNTDCSIKCNILAPSQALCEWHAPLYIFTGVLQKTVLRVFCLTAYCEGGKRAVPSSEHYFKGITGRWCI